jgi:histidyl-tRNA synthetase
MKEFGAKDSDFQIKISSRKLLNALFSDWYELDEDKAKALQRLIDRKSKMPSEEFYTSAEHIVGEPFSFLNFSDAVGAEKDELNAALAIPTIREAKEELDQVISTLKSFGLSNVVYDETLVRGFDYYTGTVFEVFDLDPENPRALYGGGRYDDLLSLFGDEKVPAVGFGAGDATMQNFLESRGLLPKYQSSADIMICVMEESARAYADEVANTERAAGKNVAINYSYKSVGDQIKAANKLSIPNIIIIGSKEAESKTYEVKKSSND